MGAKTKKCKICDKEFTPQFSSVQQVCSNKCGYKLKNRTFNKKRKKTGEGELFKELWNKRKRVSFVSGEPLGDEMNVFFFSHILTKGAYPSLRLYKKNIQFMTRKEHVMWDFNKDKIKNDPKWKHVFKLADEIRKEYIDGKITVKDC